MQPNTDVPNKLTGVLTVPPEEWQAAKDEVMRRVEENRETPPFKILRSRDGQSSMQHSFLVFPDKKSPNGWKIGAMARGKIAGEGKLGHGSFGVVKIIQYEDGNTDAVKILRHQSGEDEQKIAEQNTLNILGQLVGIFSKNHNGKDKKYIVQTRHLGVNMYEYLEKNGDSLNETEVVQLALKAVMAIKEMHEKGLCHGDIKALNFMVGPNREVMVIDFDLSSSRSDAGIKQDMQALAKMFKEMANLASVGIRNGKFQEIKMARCSSRVLSEEMERNLNTNELQILAGEIQDQHATKPDMSIQDIVDYLQERSMLKKTINLEASVSPSRLTDSASSPTLVRERARLDID